jgi:hypothetical protein
VHQFVHEQPGEQGAEQVQLEDEQQRAAREYQGGGFDTAGQGRRGAQFGLAATRRLTFGFMLRC